MSRGRCPVGGCPKPLRDLLWAAYTDHGVLDERYQAARTACISAVEA